MKQPLRPPPNLAGIDPRHWDNILSDPEISLERFMEALARRPATPFNRQLAIAIEAVTVRAVSRDYRDFRRRWLEPDEPRLEMKFLKFLDLPFWTEARLRLCWQLGWQREPPLAICDLGAGCGHLALAAQSLGHRVVGLDLPSDASDITCMFHEFRQVFGLSCRDHFISFDHPLPDDGLVYDRCVALLVNFNGEPGGSCWGPAEWRTFISRMKTQLEPSKGAALLQLTSRRTPQAAWNYLERLSRFSADGSMTVEIAASQMPTNLGDSTLGGARSA